jgi:hypothetical protein
VPLLATLFRVVLRDLDAGRVLPEREGDARARVRRERALADLALAGREGGAGRAASRARSGQRGRSVDWSGPVAGVVLPVGVAVVRTAMVGAVGEVCGLRGSPYGGVAFL